MFSVFLCGFCGESPEPEMAVAQRQSLGRAHSSGCRWRRNENFGYRTTDIRPNRAASVTIFLRSNLWQSNSAVVK